MRGLAREGKTPPDGFMAPRYKSYSQNTEQIHSISFDDHTFNCMCVSKV